MTVEQNTVEQNTVELKSKCENCRAYNATVIYLHEEKFVLCPRCLCILKELNEEYYNIVKANVRVDEQTSTSHIEHKNLK